MSKSNNRYTYSIKLIPIHEAFLNVSPFRGNLTVPTESECVVMIKTHLCSIKLIPNGDNEACLSTWPSRGNQAVLTESGWHVYTFRKKPLVKKIFH